MTHPAIIRVVICGSIDDGKSTLIGRLLAETHSVTDDALAYAAKSRRLGTQIPEGQIDYSLITDGLESEKEQGITIDVAYRQIHVAPDTRIILADTPGHEQYTRNMAVGTSRADIAVVLTDATRTITEQTFRHLIIANLMGVRKIVIAVNKLDAAINPQEVFINYQAAIKNFGQSLDIIQLDFIPISALTNINITQNQGQYPWYNGPALLQTLTAVLPQKTLSQGLSLQIQNVLRAQDKRYYTGSITTGSLTLGDTIKAVSSQVTVGIESLFVAGVDSKTAIAGDPVTFTLDNQVDLSRGDYLVKADDPSEPTRDFEATLFWFDTDQSQEQFPYFFVSGSQKTGVKIKSHKSKIDFQQAIRTSTQSLGTNDVGAVQLQTDLPIIFNTFETNPHTGNFLIVDRISKRTLAAGIVTKTFSNAADIVAPTTNQSDLKGSVYWITGRPGSGKTTVANAAAHQLRAQGLKTYVLDGDFLRQGINKDLGFSVKDRSENVRRVAQIAWLMADAGINVIVALVSPFQVDRQLARAVFSNNNFFEIYLDTPLQTCIQRDPKGHYQMAKDGQINNFTGLSQSYEIPTTPDLVLNGDSQLSNNTKLLLDFIGSTLQGQ